MAKGVRAVDGRLRQEPPAAEARRVHIAVDLQAAINRFIGLSGSTTGQGALSSEPYEITAAVKRAPGVGLNPLSWKEQPFARLWRFGGTPGGHPPCPSRSPIGQNCRTAALRDRLEAVSYGVVVLE
jgi:hypothetical protein